MIDSFFQDVIEMHSAPVPDVSVQKSSSGAFGKVLIHLPDFAKEKLPKASSLPFLPNTRHTTLLAHKIGTHVGKQVHDDSAQRPSATYRHVITIT